MKKFEPVLKSIKDVFSYRSYKLPYYQREYTWDTQQIQDLLEDFVTEFSEYYQESDNETKVSRDYGYYYIGSIIVDADANLVDAIAEVQTSVDEASSWTPMPTSWTGSSACHPSPCS